MAEHCQDLTSGGIFDNDAAWGIILRLAGTAVECGGIVIVACCLLRLSIYGEIEVLDTGSSTSLGGSVRTGELRVVRTLNARRAIGLAELADKRGQSCIYYPLRIYSAVAMPVPGIWHRARDHLAIPVEDTAAGRRGVGRCRLVCCRRCPNTTC